MQYMLLVHSDDSGLENATPEALEAILAPYMAYNDALRKAGVWVTGEQLAPAETSHLIRKSDNGMDVLDGPFAEAKEQLGGYYVIAVSSLDDALAWAKRCPAAEYGTVEVRAIIDNGN
ncbi:MAG: YciI family protein [Rhizobiaceae bacterium]